MKLQSRCHPGLQSSDASPGLGICFLAHRAGQVVLWPRFLTTWASPCGCESALIASDCLPEQVSQEVIRCHLHNSVMEIQGRKRPQKGMTSEVTGDHMGVGLP